MENIENNESRYFPWDEEDRIDGIVSDLEWKYAKYKELLRMYKLICGVINRSEESALSAANVTSLWANVFDRMVDAYECFRDEKKLREDVIRKKYSLEANQEFQKIVNQKFVLKNFENEGDIQN
jgi:Leu/Phe-tRNA-protein transferase